MRDRRRQPRLFYRAGCPLTADVHRLQTPGAAVRDYFRGRMGTGGWVVWGAWGFGIFLRSKDISSTSRMAKFVTMARSRIVCVLRSSMNGHARRLANNYNFFVFSFDDL